jgi:subfamily B ATP-binding cassette protein MsbA
MKIPENKKIAIVGHSGCGKSTISNLLLRLYDLNEGSLKIDGIDIKDYSISKLR